MLKKALASLFVWLAVSAGAHAQVSTGAVGVNYGGDITVAAGTGTHGSGVYPTFTEFDRIYDASVGSTFHATWWSTLNTSAGVYNWQPLDQILQSLQSKGKISEYTLSGVPSYVNGTQNVTGSTQQGQFTTFLSAMMAHVAANGQCFGYFSLWNEINQPSTYWVGTSADMATLSALAYPIIKAACPSTVVLTPSITAGVNSGAAPNGPFAYWNAYLAACATNCFDVLNVHGYPLAPSLQTANALVTFAPELLVSSVTNAKAVASANGLGALPLYLDEGYAASDPASTAISANTTGYAAAQAQQLIIAASAGVKAYANSFFGDGCTNQTACGNEFVHSPSLLNLTFAGRAKRQIVSWLSGATFSTPYARTVGTNLITVPPNDVSVATGNIGGSGGSGCPSPPAGTGSLPTGWALSASASIAGGMSYYVVGSGASGGLPYIDIRMCGTDTSGANSDSIRMTNFVGAATVGQSVVLSECLGLAAGTLAGIQEDDLQINEYKAGPTYDNQFMVQGQIQIAPTASVAVASQCYQTRYVMTASDATIAVPYYLFKHYGSVAIDRTVRLAAPHEDVNATQWSGAISKTGGYTATIAADASGKGAITAPAGTVDYRDIYGNVRKSSAGATIPLTLAPVLIETTGPKVSIPVTTVGYFAQASGNDSNAGTITAPFATLNKCHTSMQAGSVKTCYVRGTIATASWNVGNGETWTSYAGDAKGTAIVNYSGSASIGCFSGCNNITFYGLTVNGGTAGNNLFAINSSNHIYFDDDILDATVTQALSGYNNDYIYLRGSTINGLVNSGWDSVSLPRNDNLSHSNTFVTDNTFHICGRLCLEMQSLPGNAGTSSFVYVDRNEMDTFEGTHGTCAAGTPTFGGASLVYGPGNNSSVQGNTLTIPSNANTCSVGMELEMGGATVQNNTFNYEPIAIQCCGASGGQYAGAGQYFNSNTINVPITNTSVGALGGLVSFGKDGGFSTPAQFTIGTNLIVGSGSNSVTGCTDSAGTSPGFCGLGTNTFPPTPPLTPASPIWSN